MASGVMLVYSVKSVCNPFEVNAAMLVILLEGGWWREDGGSVYFKAMFPLVFMKRDYQKGAYCYTRNSGSYSSSKCGCV
jgi:hypothetical protein